MQAMKLYEEISQDQGPVVQSIVSLKSSLVVKFLTVLVSTISNSQVFLLKNASSFCKCKSYSHFFSKNISYMPYLMIKVLTTSLDLNNWAQAHKSDAAWHDMTSFTMTLTWLKVKNHCIVTLTKQNNTQYRTLSVEEFIIFIRTRFL